MPASLSSKDHSDSETSVKGTSAADNEIGNIPNDSTKHERHIIRRIDRRLLPLLGLLYALALIDRTNLSIARATGMGRDLDLSVGARYSIVSCIYFVPNILLELPCNVFLRVIGVRRFLAFCAVGWGAVQLGMGFAPNWGILAFCRALLGAFEAGFFPALVFIITTWYKRHEVQTRLAAMYMTSILAGGFSAIFAYALSLLAGKGNLNGWSWIFVIEGAITIIFGLVAWSYLPEFPDRNNFLTAAETAFVLRRVEEDRADSLPDGASWHKILSHLGDWTLWVYSLMYMCTTVAAYAIGFFITVIISSMGWNTEMTLLLCAPPYVFAAFSVFVFAWLSDRFHSRAVFLAIQTLMTMIGLIMISFLDAPAGRYVGIFLANAGSAGNIPGLLAYSSNNVVSHSKRAVTTALTISFGGIGGILATTLFRQKDFPTYLPGMLTTIALQVLSLAMLAGMTLCLWRRNRAILASTRGSGTPFLYTL